MLFSIATTIVLLQVLSLFGVVWTYRRNRLSIATVNAAVRKLHDDTFTLFDALANDLIRLRDGYVPAEDYRHLVDSYLDAMTELIKVNPGRPLEDEVVS